MNVHDDMSYIYNAAVDVSWLPRKVQLRGDADSPEITYDMEIPVLRLSDDVIKLCIDVQASKADESAKDEVEITRKMCAEELLAYEAQCVYVCTHIMIKCCRAQKSE